MKVFSTDSALFLLTSDYTVLFYCNAGLRHPEVVSYRESGKTNKYDIKKRFPVFYKETFVMILRKYTEAYEVTPEDDIDSIHFLNAN